MSIKNVIFSYIGDFRRCLQRFFKNMRTLLGGKLHVTVYEGYVDIMGIGRVQYSFATQGYMSRLEIDGLAFNALSDELKAQAPNEHSMLLNYYSIGEDVSPIEEWEKLGYQTHRENCQVI